eukprot:scaffold122034_cov51-Phaeocystis_antarctica.AAC.3
MDLFRSWDADSSGKVDRQEFRKAIAMLGLTGVHRDEVDELFDGWGGGDGSIDFKELTALLRNKPAPQMRPASAALTLVQVGPGGSWVESPREQMPYYTGRGRPYSAMGNSHRPRPLSAAGMPFELTLAPTLTLTLTLTLALALTLTLTLTRHALRGAEADDRLHGTGEEGLRAPGGGGGPAELAQSQFRLVLEEGPCPVRSLPRGVADLDAAAALCGHDREAALRSCALQHALRPAAARGLRGQWRWEQWSSAVECAESAAPLRAHAQACDALDAARLRPGQLQWQLQSRPRRPPPLLAPHAGAEGCALLLPRARARRVAAAVARVGAPLAARGGAGQRGAPYGRGGLRARLQRHPLAQGGADVAQAALLRLTEATGLSPEEQVPPRRAAAPCEPRAMAAAARAQDIEPAEGAEDPPDQGRRRHRLRQALHDVLLNQCMIRVQCGVFTA